MVSTNYGEKHKGTSRFIIVAPHIAGGIRYRQTKLGPA